MGTDYSVLMFQLAMPFSAYNISCGQKLCALTDVQAHTHIYTLTRTNQRVLTHIVNRSTRGPRSRVRVLYIIHCEQYIYLYSEWYYQRRRLRRRRRRRRCQQLTPLAWPLAHAPIYWPYWRTKKRTHMCKYMPYMCWTLYSQRLLRRS